MAWEFHVGQRVVCIAHDWVPCRGQTVYSGLIFPKKDVVYTIRDLFIEERVVELDGVLLLRLVEIVNPVFGYAEAAFRADSFKPIDERRIDVFRQLLAPQPSQRQREDA